MNRALLVLTLTAGSLGVAGRTAHAGSCDLDSLRILGDELTERAKQPKLVKETIGTWGICLRDEEYLPSVPKTAPKLEARLMAACTKIMDRVPDDGMCAEVAARLGHDMVGTHDVVAAIAASENRIQGARDNELFAATRAARAAPIVIQRWKELQPQAERQARDSDLMNDWAAWRGTAAHALAVTGGADAKAFLGEILATPALDRGVKRACQAAVAAIEKRLAAK